MQDPTQTETRERKCVRMGCDHPASIAVSATSRIILCMRCAQLHVKAALVSVPETDSTNESDENFMLTLESGERIAMQKQADVSFYMKNASSAQPAVRKKRTKASVIAAFNVASQTLNDWKKDGQTMVMDANNALLGLYILYRGTPRHATTGQAEVDSKVDHIAWPASVYVDMLPCTKHKAALSGWHAVANTLDRFVAIWSSLLSESIIMEGITPNFTALSKQIRGRTDDNPSEDDLRRNLKLREKELPINRHYLTWLILRQMNSVSDLRTAFKQLPESVIRENKNIRTFIASVDPKDQDTASKKGNMRTFIQSFGDDTRDLLYAIILKGNVSMRARILPTNGVVVMDETSASAVAFIRMLVPDSATLLPFFAAASREDEADISGAAGVKLMEELTKTGRSSHVANYMWHLWTFVYRTEYNNASFIYHIGNGIEDRAADDDSWISEEEFKPPGILLMQEEMRAYPDISRMKGRFVGFVVNTNMPAVSLSKNLFTDTPTIDLNIGTDGSPTIIERPPWETYGHWVSAILQVKDDMTWSWSIQDSSNPKKSNDVLQDHGSLVRELTIYVVGMIQIAAAIEKAAAAAAAPAPK